MVLLSAVEHSISAAEYGIIALAYNKVNPEIIAASMSKQIEMEQIVEQPVVGTEIFDPNMPSTIDFDHPTGSNSQKAHIAQQKKLIPEMGKVILIGDQMASFSVRGKLTKQPQLKYFPNVPITVQVSTIPVKIEDEQTSGLMKLWSSLVGHSKRQLLLQDGYMYILLRRKQGLFVRATFNLAMLFKLFVDPQEQRIRMVVRQEQHVITRDIFPDNFIVMTERIQYQLVQMGLSLVQ